MLLVAVLTLASAAATEAATLRVNTTKDEIGGSKCSLREAIDTVNSPRTRTSCGTADTFSNLIVLGAKTYQLSIPPRASGHRPKLHRSDRDGPRPKRQRRPLRDEQREPDDRWERLSNHHQR